MKKSIETRPWIWLFRKVFQVCDGGLSRLGMSRETVRSERLIPNLSSSPWIRGAPQSGLASAIFRIRWLTSGLTPGRPARLCLEIQVQKRRSPCRCQLRTVSGRTNKKAFRQLGQIRDSQAKNNRSAARSRGRGDCRHHRQLLTQRKILQSDFSDISSQKKQMQQRRQKCDHADKSRRSKAEKSIILRQM